MKLNKKIKKCIIYSFLFIAIVSSGTYLFTRDKKSKVEYKTVTIERSNMQSVIQATGTLDAVETIDVGTKISGTISEIYIDYNSIVKKGD